MPTHPCGPLPNGRNVYGWIWSLFSGKKLQLQILTVVPCLSYRSGLNLSGSGQYFSERWIAQMLKCSQSPRSIRIPSKLQAALLNVYMKIAVGAGASYSYQKTAKIAIDL
jgi:hypothetical protein